MSEKVKISIVLADIPAYSETFINSKIKGLINNKKQVSLFVNKSSRELNSQINVPVYIQLNIKKRLNIIAKLFLLLIKKPLVLFRFIYIEYDLGITLYDIFKHLILNYHILLHKADWIHFEFSTLGIGRENVAKAIGAKLSTSIRGFDIGLYPFKNPRCYDLLWKRIDKIHTISNDLYTSALKLGLSDKVKVHKITPAVDPELFPLIKKNNFNNPFMILSVGRLVWKKGFEYSLKALHILKKEGFKFKYTIVGDGEYRDSILYSINQFNLQDDVVLKGVLSHKDTLKEMTLSDIYLQPSIQEGFCNAALEAQAMGLLCVVSDAEGLSENVLNNKTGWVVKKRNSELIANQIRLIINTKFSKLEQIRQAGILRVKSDFNFLSQEQEWNCFYE